MICSQDLCFEARLVRGWDPQRTGRPAVCVDSSAVSHWRQLLQALYYSVHWQGPARDPNISALLFLAGTTQIREALALSPRGGEALCASLGGLLPEGEPYYPSGEWDPWRVTSFALKLAESL